MSSAPGPSFYPESGVQRPPPAPYRSDSVVSLYFIISAPPGKGSRDRDETIPIRYWQWSIAAYHREKNKWHCHEMLQNLEVDDKAQIYDTDPRGKHDYCHKMLAICGMTEDQCTNDYLWDWLVKEMDQDHTKLYPLLDEIFGGKLRGKSEAYAFNVAAYLMAKGYCTEAQIQKAALNFNAFCGMSHLNLRAESKG